MERQWAVGHYEENNLQPFRNTGTEEGNLSWNKCCHTKYYIVLWMAGLRTWYYSCYTHACLSVLKNSSYWCFYCTVNLEHVSIKTIQWLHKKTQQHTQVNMGLFARRFEMVPMWACSYVITRTVKAWKALSTCCFLFTQSEALMLPWAGAVYSVLNTFSSLKDKNVSQRFIWGVSKVTSFPNTAPIFTVDNTQSVFNCPKSIRLAPCDA